MFAVTTWKALALCTSASLSFSFSLSAFWFILPLWWPLASLTLMFLNNGEGGGHLMPLLSSTRLSFALLIFPNMLCSNVSFLLLSFPFFFWFTPLFSPLGDVVLSLSLRRKEGADMKHIAAGRFFWGRCDSWTRWKTSILCCKLLTSGYTTLLKEIWDLILVPWPLRWYGNTMVSESLWIYFCISAQSIIRF